MLRARCGAGVLVALALAFSVASATEFGPKASRAELRRVFTALRATQALNVDGPLRWRYRFSGHDRRTLEALSVALVGEGFRIVTLGPERASGPVFLVVERTERQTPSGLEQRNREMTERARAVGAASYDGCEALPADRPQ